MIRWHFSLSFKIKTMAKTKLYRQMFQSYEILSIIWIQTWGHCKFSHGIQGYEWLFFPFRTLCPTFALFMSNTLCFYRICCLRCYDIRRCARTTNLVLRFFIIPGYTTNHSKHTLWKRFRNTSHARNFL